jgi:hypothetical protein
MALTNKEIIEQVQSQENRQRISDDRDRFMVYNGKLKEVIQKAISREFDKPETIRQLFSRIIPVNITQKIINKLAGLYNSPPFRTPMDKNPADQDLIDLYGSEFKINRNGKLANRYFKLHKHALWQPFLDQSGIPRLRTMPSQTYTPFSDDRIQPDRPTMIVKHLVFDGDLEKQRFEIWTDEKFLIVDGKGNIDLFRMQQLDNLDGVNPFGRLPFVYISDDTDGNLIPISDDDLISMQVVICVLLTDLAFASKYQLWSVIALKGANSNQNIDWNPNSVVKLPPGVEIEAIKPKLDTLEALQFIESLISMLLTTKNLSVGEVSAELSVGRASSGVAKLIDQSETTEDRLDQEQVFRDSETQLWDLFAHSMLPVWVQSGQINSDFVGKFSDSFALSIRYPDPKPKVSDAEVVDVEIKKLNENLTTRELALREIYPEFSSEEVKNLNESIVKEKKEAVDKMREAFSSEDKKDLIDGSDSEV